jgi:uncharacterized membrane protein
MRALARFAQISNTTTRTREVINIRTHIKQRRLLGAMIAGLLIIAFVPSTAVAQSIQVITDYPFVSVEAGKSVDFDVKVITSSRQRVSLRIVDLPAGWKANLRGGGFVVHGVFGDPETPPPVQLSVQVAAGAKNGDHNVVVRGTTSGGVSSDLTLTLRVAESVEGAVSLDAEFPELRGNSDATFNFSVSITNNTPDERTFALNTEGPEGWVVGATPSAQSQAATIQVEGGGTGTIDVAVDPIDESPAGTYEVKLTADGGGQRAETTLTVEITGNVSLEITTPDERLNADVTAGRTTELAIVVHNRGTTPVEDVALSSTPPAGWEVTFEPEVIEMIEAGGTGEATAVITASGEAVSGDYVVSLLSSGGGANDDVDIRVTVKTSLLWGSIGVLVIAAALYVLFVVFRRYGRR